MTNLFELDWDSLEHLIEKTLDRMIRAYDDFKYLIVDSNHMLVKIYEDNEVVFTVEFWYTSGRLEVNKAW